jgi:hypothetical protein
MVHTHIWALIIPYSQNISVVPEKNLVQLLANLTSCCDDMLEKPSKIVSTKVKVTSVYPFQLDDATGGAAYGDRVISLTTVSIRLA